jgi:nucleoside-diphosphate-sugar epimerase
VAAPKVLITGATGFVGSHVVERLVDLGIPVRALVRAASMSRALEERGAEIVTGGLGDAEALGRAVHGVDVVLHLAASTHARSAAEYHRVNATGTRDLVEASLGASARPGRFVYLSSLAAVGPSRDGQPIHPEDEPRPLTAYGTSKLEGERVCLAAGSRLEVTVLRAPAVYGPGDRELYRFFRLAAAGIVPIPGGPSRRLQLLHVRDLAEAITRAVLAPAGKGIVHVADPASYAWEEVARLVADAVGVNARVVRIPTFFVEAGAAFVEGITRLTGRSSMLNREKARELLAPGWLCETETARVALGFETSVALPEGLRETARWYREHGWL